MNDIYSHFILIWQSITGNEKCFWMSSLEIWVQKHYDSELNQQKFLLAGMYWLFLAQVKAVAETKMFHLLMHPFLVI